MCRVQPASFAWFTPSYYAPGLGFLMFAVGVNLQLKAFATVFKTPKVKDNAVVPCISASCTYYFTHIALAFGAAAHSWDHWSMDCEATSRHAFGIHSSPSFRFANRGSHRSHFGRLPRRAFSSAHRHEISAMYCLTTLVNHSTLHQTFLPLPALIQLQTRPHKTSE